METMKSWQYAPNDVLENDVKLKQENGNYAINTMETMQSWPYAPNDLLEND